MKNLDSLYSEHTTPSGQTVKIRPRTFEEWEKHEEERAASHEAIRAAGEGAAVAGIAHIKKWRTKLLETQVKDFAKLKKSLTMQDIDFIEQTAVALERYEVPMGNSPTGGGGS